MNYLELTLPTHIRASDLSCVLNTVHELREREIDRRKRDVVAMVSFDRALDNDGRTIMTAHFNDVEVLAHRGKSP